MDTFLTHFSLRVERKLFTPVIIHIIYKKLRMENRSAGKLGGAGTLSLRDYAARVLGRKRWIAPPPLYILVSFCGENTKHRIPHGQGAVYIWLQLYHRPREGASRKDTTSTTNRKSIYAEYILLQLFIVHDEGKLVRKLMSRIAIYIAFTS